MTSTVTVQSHGHEREPVVVIDGFAPEAEALNRAIVYRSHTLHCALLPEDLPLTPIPGADARP